MFVTVPQKKELVLQQNHQKTQSKYDALGVATCFSLWRILEDMISYSKYWTFPSRILKMYIAWEPLSDLPANSNWFCALYHCWVKWTGKMFAGKPASQWHMHHLYLLVNVSTRKQSSHWHIWWPEGTENWLVLVQLYVQDLGITKLHSDFCSFSYRYEWPNGVSTILGNWLGECPHCFGSTIMLPHRPVLNLDPSSATRPRRLQTQLPWNP